MSTRLGSALADHIRRRIRESGSDSGYFLVEGVPASVADGMTRAWDSTLPELAVVSAEPRRFGRYALREVSGTYLRNRPGTHGVVLVLCDGEQVPDRQSLSQFESISPSALLDTAEGMGILSQQPTAVNLDGPARSVREAINEASAATRPSAIAVASYLDRLAAGADPLAALPLLGAFIDTMPADGRVDADRIGDNLALARRRTSEDLLKASAYADLRLRAQRVLKRRPSLSSPNELIAAIDRVMTMLQSGSPELLTELYFDEAREILEQRAQDLVTVVRREIADYRADLQPGSQASGLPWATYESRATALRRGAARRDAAQELLDLDTSQQQQVFTGETRIKLERLLRDKAVNGSDPSCPEAAFIRAAQQLGGLIDRIEVLAPIPPVGAARTNRTGAGKMLTLACARLRLGWLMREWDRAAGEVDGLLLKAANDEDLPDLLASFGDAGLALDAPLPVLQLRLSDINSNTVQVDWSPDLDDVAMLRAAILFAAEPALTLRLDDEPTLHAFCGPANATPDLSIPGDLVFLARELQTTAQTLLDSGINPAVLDAWTGNWTQACVEREAAGDATTAEALALAGAVRGRDQTAALTFLSPLKAEWVSQYHQALWQLLHRAEEPGTLVDPTDAVTTSSGVAHTTAAHHPAHLRLRTQDRPLLPTSEGRVWSLYGGASSQDESGFAGTTLRSVVIQLLTLQPEAAGHLRCLAWGPGSADLLAREAVRLIGTRVGKATVNRVEIFCIGEDEDDKPRWETLKWADDELQEDRDVLELRYISTLDRAKRLLRPTAETPAVHLALVTGLTDGGNRLQIVPVEVSPPGEDSEALFTPRGWQRAKLDRRTLLMPPAATPAGHLWLKLQNAVEDSWPEPGALIQVPEVRTGTLDIATQLQQVHDLALWVATLDRYATRDSLEQALGNENVAILHQERRLGGDSPLSLVLSQKSGGPADRAIGRSLRAARIVSDSGVALSIGTKLRQVASQGYGILALEAATSGTGINELVGHVVAFSLLATTTTPWPLPPGCRVLLVSLDEYRQWFPGKRADLLAIALDPREGGVHVAAIEVKARRTDEVDAASGALDQLTQTLTASRWAAYPAPGSIHTRIWLNRIAEAAYAVARESRFKLDATELQALEAFRLGRGTLEWAGVGLVFGPKVSPYHKIYRKEVSGDIVPIVLYSIQLTEQLLTTATSVHLTELRTVETDQPPLQSTRVRRRPEGKPNGDDGQPMGETRGQDSMKQEVFTPDARYDEETTPSAAMPATAEQFQPEEPSGAVALETFSLNEQRVAPGIALEATYTVATGEFRPPLLGWDGASGEEVHWHPAGDDRDPQNGHIEIWGSSGMGKTQFTMILLAQLARRSGSHFGICDFKNDYGNDSGFPELAAAQFLDLWSTGAPYNPLALEDTAPRAIETAVIELRDAVDEATKAYTRMGVKQRGKLQTALEAAYQIGRQEGRWPTLRTLDDLLDADLAAVLGDLTRHELFKAGEPLGTVIDRNVIFGLSAIPGNGQTTMLAAGFILSALLLRIQNLPPVPNTIRYIMVIDEAHRVTGFKAIQTMTREGRSKGLAVVLATQQPLDLPEVVATNAQTKICFGLPDATVAAMAARKLQPDNPRLAEQIRTLGVGEAVLAVAGRSPRLMRMAQAYRDAEMLGLLPLTRS
jgi:hypothetical protein